MFDKSRIKHFSILLKRLKEPNNYNILEVNQSVENVRTYFINASKKTVHEDFFLTFEYKNILKDGYDLFQNKIKGL